MKKVLILLAALTVFISGCIVSEESVKPAEATCINSGGTIRTSLCCQSTEDFPNLCLIGACGCSPENSHEVKTCDCGAEKCWNGETCVNFTQPI